MFVVSVKTGKKKIFILMAAVLLVAVSVIAAVKLHQIPAPGAAQSSPAATNGERIAFLARYGWNVEAEPLEIREVTIPLNFNDVYGEYNEIQKAQDMDLLPYAGKRCKQWVYRVTNHPQGDARANLLVYDERVIGGDISSPALDGFMTGFMPEPGGQTGSTAEPGALPDAASSQAPPPETGSQPPEAGSQLPQAESAAPAAAEPIPDDAWPTD